MAKEVHHEENLPMLKLCKLNLFCNYRDVLKQLITAIMSLCINVLRKHTVHTFHCADSQMGTSFERSPAKWLEYRTVTTFVISQAATRHAFSLDIGDPSSIFLDAQ